MIGQPTHLRQQLQGGWLMQVQAVVGGIPREDRRLDLLGDRPVDCRAKAAVASSSVAAP